MCSSFKNIFLTLSLLLLLLVFKCSSAVKFSSLIYNPTEEVDDAGPLIVHPSPTIFMCSHACENYGSCPQISWDAQQPLGKKCRLLLSSYKFQAPKVEPPVSTIFTISQIGGKKIVQYEYGAYNSWDLCYNQCTAIGGKMFHIPTTALEYNFVSCFYTMFVDGVRQPNEDVFYGSDGSELNIGAVIGWSSGQPSEKNNTKVGIRTNREGLNDIIAVADYANTPVKCVCLQLIDCKTVLHYGGDCKTVLHHGDDCKTVLHHGDDCKTVLHHGDNCKTVLHHAGDCKTVLHHGGDCKTVLHHAGCAVISANKQKACAGTSVLLFVNTRRNAELLGVLPRDSSTLTLEVADGGG
ncbi:C-type lectin fold [Trinorchestia longiramus]|nr:C-type lectin fold [Trinorchestia longiramus]